MRVAGFALVLLAILAASGCMGGGDGGTDNDGPATTSPRETTPAPTTSAGSTTPSPSPSISPPASPRPPITVEIVIEDNDFVDGSLSILEGDTVRWIHRDGTTAHTVTADDGSFDSSPPGSTPMIQAPLRDTFSFTFESDGEFPYHCRVHPGMQDTITVADAP